MACSGAFDETAPERYIPKNVFFLREEVLIYDAPSLPRKDNRFDQELPSIRGSKVWRKGLDQRHGLYCESTIHPVYHAKISPFCTIPIIHSVQCIFVMFLTLRMNGPLEY